MQNIPSNLNNFCAYSSADKTTGYSNHSANAGSNSSSCCSCNLSCNHTGSNRTTCTCGNRTCKDAHVLCILST